MNDSNQSYKDEFSAETLIPSSIETTITALFNFFYTLCNYLKKVFFKL